VLRFRCHRHEEYPAGANFVISPPPGETYRRHYAGMEVTFCGLSQWEAMRRDRENR
jgi:hypothetical protein